MTLRRALRLRQALPTTVWRKRSCRRCRRGCLLQSVQRGRLPRTWPSPRRCRNTNTPMTAIIRATLNSAATPPKATPATSPACCYSSGVTLWATLGRQNTVRMSVVLLSSVALAACGGSGDSASVSTGSEDNFASTNPPPVDSSAKSDSAATHFAKCLMPMLRCLGLERLKPAASPSIVLSKT